MYGLTKDNLIVKLDICKCEMCVERGMYEIFVDKLNGEYVDCVKLLKIKYCDCISDILIFVSNDLEKIEKRWIKERHKELIKIKQELIKKVEETEKEIKKLEENL